MKLKTIQLTLTCEEFAFIHETLQDAIYNKRYKLHRKDAQEKARKQIANQLFSSLCVSPVKKKRILKKVR